MPVFKVRLFWPWVSGKDSETLLGSVPEHEAILQATLIVRMASHLVIIYPE
jgi:hypothetical protein